MHTGYSMQPYVDADLLSALDDVWATEGLDKVVPPVLQDMSRLQGHYYALPIGVHRTNVVWYNKALLDKEPHRRGHASNLGRVPRGGRNAAGPGGCRSDRARRQLDGHARLRVHHGELGMMTYEDWINGKIKAPGDPRIIQAFTI
jgi:glucose/mannose transport system substrate-binding protein